MGGLTETKSGKQTDMRLRGWAPWLLGMSILARIGGSIPVSNTLFIDLRVYLAAVKALNHGHLYTTYFVDTHGDHLPFIYPPFAAMLFYPL